MTDNKKISVYGIASTCVAAILAIALVIVLVGGNQTSATSQAIPQKYFQTPEQAAEFFAKSVSDNDFESALSAFAITEKAEKFDFKALVDRIQAFMPINLLAPEYESYNFLNGVNLLNQAATTVKCFVYSFNYSEDLGQMEALRDSGRTPTQIFEQLDPVKVRGLKLVRIDYVNPLIQDSETNQANNKKQEAVYGSTDTKDYLALYELDGKYYFGGFQFGKYSGGWQINMLSSPIGNISAYGSVEEISMDGYLEMIAN